MDVSKKSELIAYFSADLFAVQACGITIEDVDENGAQCRMAVTATHLNAQGVVQGGAIFTLADFAFAVAANAGGAPTVSLGAQIHFLRPGTGRYLTDRKNVV